MAEDSNQISMNVRYPYRYGRENLFHFNMLLDDLSFNKYSYNKEIKFDFQSDSLSGALEDIKTKFELSTESWGRVNMTDEFLDFFVLIAYRLIEQGICCFEKVSTIKDEKIIKIPLIKGDVKKRKRQIIQTLQTDTEKLIAKIPLNKCYVLEFPSEICSTEEYLNALYKIKDIDSKDPVFSFLNPSPLNKIKGYDAFQHRKYLDLLLWKITKKISWHHRSHFSQKEIFSNYYTTLRDLNFKKTKLILMNHVFRFIEKMISEEIEGVKLNITFTKSLDDIELLIENFKRGDFKSDDYLQAIKDFH